MGLYEITIAHRYSFVMEENADLVVRSLQRGEVWETTALNLWAEVCRGLTGTVLDIGAYTGIYSLLTATVSEKATIEAFEPLTPVFNRLKENIFENRLQDQIIPHKTALSNQTSNKLLNITGTSYLPSGSSLDNHPRKKNIASSSVQTQTGDFLFRDADIQLIKIDVERHEFFVIKGLQDTLKRCRPICFIEILDRTELDNILPLMKSLGYNHVELICEDLKSTVTDHRVYEPKTNRTNYIFKI